MRHHIYVLAIALATATSSPAPLDGPETDAVPSPGDRAVPSPGDRAVPYARHHFVAPLVGDWRVTRRFDPPAVPWGRGHRGVDLAAAVGATVRSAGAGTVSYAGRIADRSVVSVTHDGGLRTTYEPVDPVLVAGTRVDPGTAIGTVAAGHRGCPVPACLHWGLRHDGDGATYLDPLLLLGNGRVRLLPLAQGEQLQGVAAGPGAGPPEPADRGLAAGASSRHDRAAPEAVRRSGRTLRPGCRPGRRCATRSGRTTS
ncbi:M23 family metallopeptidase [Solwaraspora sp. WMMB335]|uniref:M23 family metallopeptidase n=1 Tax=Solwaraspora sp. WMMB335 TaxID=3404118 RepID=UPI003B9354B1